jgi:limonene-1,2-epoxide hydrolase
VLQDTAVQRIVHYLENNSARENDLYFSDKISFTKAVLVGTLHGDEDLTVSVFKLLHQQISFEVGVARLAADATVVPTHAVSSSDAQYSVSDLIAPIIAMLLP